MSLLERVKFLSNKQKISLKELALKLGMGESAIYKWDKSAPSSDNLQKVADYFGVSTDYLLGRTTDERKPEDDLTAFFRINTEGMSEDEIDTLKEELEDFMVIRAERLKRKKAKKDD